jgi:hypothetical protein
VFPPSASSSSPSLDLNRRRDIPLSVLEMRELAEGDDLGVAESAPYVVTFRRFELRGEGSKSDMVADATEMWAWSCVLHADVLSA